MTQQELFDFHMAGNLLMAEPATMSRLASGNNTTGDNFTPLPPPASASPLPPFARNSETSRQAAIAKYDAHDSQNQRDTIFRWIKFCGEKGATREEIQDALELSGDTARPRIKELLGEMTGYDIPKIKVKMIERVINGETKIVPETRKTKSGRDAEVLVVA